jgi:YegS/Rv2252/BmrU family lipid kinase
MSNPSFCFLINPKAGNGRAIATFNKIKPYLNQLPINYKSIITESIEHAQIAATSALQQGEKIAIVGGDGSARAVVGIIHELNGVLAFIPAGRGNDLARMLNIPLNPLKACDLLTQGKEMQIDLGEINEELFLTICYIGVDSLTSEIANKQRFLKGPLVYLYAGLKAIIQCKPIHYKLTIDGTIHEHTGYMVAIANSQYYGGGMQIAPYASLQDGLLDIVLLDAISKLAMIKTLPKLYSGTHITVPGFKVLRGREIHIDAYPPIAFYADGDSISFPPATIKVIPSALKILTPP